MSKTGKQTLKICKERRVIEGPWTGLVEVPLIERERMSESQPVTMDLEICAAVRWDQ